MQSNRCSLTFERQAPSRTLLLHASCIFLVTCFAYFLSPKTEAVCSSETSVNFYQLHGVTSHKLVTTVRISNLIGTFLVATMSRMATRHTQCPDHSPQPTVKVENLLISAPMPPIHLHGVAQCCLY
jgi:hypothetical protein